MKLPPADLVEVMDAISPIATNNNKNNNSMPIDTPSATELSRDTILDSLSTVPTGRIRAFLVQEGVLERASVAEEYADSITTTVNQVSSSVATDERVPQKEDDLTKITGIGPKISLILQDRGIRTFVQLSSLTVPQLQQILAQEGTHFRLANPETWPEQSKLAADGNWEKLTEFQERIASARHSKS